MSETVGQTTLRAENISKVVTGFALQKYKFKQICTVDSSSAWIESYFTEGATELTGGTKESIHGVPRLAAFPYLEPNWTKTSSYLEKYGGEAIVSYEDEIADNIPVIARSLLRVGGAIAKAVDDRIFFSMSGATGINTVAAEATWNNATVANRNPIQDILNAEKEIFEDNYDIYENGYLLVDPAHYAYLIGNAKVMQNPTFKSADVVTNGVVAEICGLKVIPSNSVNAALSGAWVVKGQDALTWKSAVPLTVESIREPGIKTTIRGWEVGVCQVPNPAAICKITGV